MISTGRSPGRSTYKYIVPRYVLENKMGGGPRPRPRPPTPGTRYSEAWVPLQAILTSLRGVFGNP